MLSVYELGLVRVLPYLGQGNRAMEPEEDAERQGQLLDDHPSLVAEELDLEQR